MMGGVARLHNRREGKAGGHYANVKTSRKFRRQGWRLGNRLERAFRDQQS